VATGVEHEDRVVADLLDQQDQPFSTIVGSHVTEVSVTRAP
jgi:hypothetical protein